MDFLNVNTIMGLVAVVALICATLFVLDMRKNKRTAAQEADALKPKIAENEAKIGEFLRTANAYAENLVRQARESFAKVAAPTTPMPVPGHVFANVFEIGYALGAAGNTRSVIIDGQLAWSGTNPPATFVANVGGTGASSFLMES